MTIDKWKLLAWMAEREESEPTAPTMHGSMLVERASALNDGEGDRFQAVARAAGQLKRLGYIDWIHQGYMPSEAEPRPEDIDQAAIQRTRDIAVTDPGHQALDRRAGLAAGTQINISNSVVGQLTLGDITKIDFSVILSATERALDDLDATTEEKEQARNVIQRMRDAGGTVASSAVSSVLGAALRQALGLP